LELVLATSFGLATAFGSGFAGAGRGAVGRADGAFALVAVDAGLDAGLSCLAGRAAGLRGAALAAGRATAAAFGLPALAMGFFAAGFAAFFCALGFRAAAALALLLFIWRELLRPYPGPVRCRLLPSIPYGGCATDSDAQDKSCLSRASRDRQRRYSGTA
jgi:hypothetical protein